MKRWLLKHYICLVQKKHMRICSEQYIWTYDGIRPTEDKMPKLFLDLYYAADRTMLV